MQRIYVDFNRSADLNRVEVGYADESRLQGVTLREGEHVILHDDGFEVQGVLHQETDRLGKPYWYADADWATRKEYDVTPFLSHGEPLSTSPQQD